MHNSVSILFVVNNYGSQRSKLQGDKKDIFNMDIENNFEMLR